MNDAQRLVLKWIVDQAHAEPTGNVGVRYKEALAQLTALGLKLEQGAIWQIVQDLVSDGHLKSVHMSGDLLTPEFVRPTEAGYSAIAETPATTSAPQEKKGMGSERSIGPWQVLKNLKSGAQGEVFLVEHERRYERGVLKRISPKKQDDDQALKRLEREIQTLKALEHPCIVTVLDHFLKQGESYLVTEWARFGAVEAHKALFKDDAWRVLRLARDVALGLGAAHAAGVIHRDVKPGNILLLTLNHAVVGDFGIAHVDDAPTLTATEERVRAQWFGPPEAEAGRLDEPSPSFDVYGLGKVIYYLLTGGKKFPRERFLENSANLVNVLGRPAYQAINTLLEKMILERAEDRLQSMGDVVRELDTCLWELFGRGAETTRENATSAGDHDPVDMLNLLKQHIRHRYRSGSVIKFAEVDKALKLPSGSTKQHIVPAANALEYQVDQMGATTAVLKGGPKVPHL